MISPDFMKNHQRQTANNTLIFMHRENMLAVRIQCRPVLQGHHGHIFNNFYYLLTVGLGLAHIRYG